MANGLGNLVQRTITLIDSSLGGELIYKPAMIEKEIKDKVDQLFKEYVKDLDSFLLHESLGRTWDLIGVANKYLDDHKPWVSVKENPEKFLATMNNVVFILYNVAWMLTPFMPETANKIFTILGANRDAETLENYKFLVQKSGGLFPRIS